MGKILYNFGVYSYYLGVRIASMFNEKAQLWLSGREDWRSKLRESIKKLDPDQKNIWFHVSSLGEFEQGRPVMEQLKNDKKINLIVSFYSPSGYEQMKDWPLADLITYLPLDTEKNASDFIDIIKPDLSLFVKYDLWYHYLHELNLKKIPALLISGRFYSSQVYFKPWASWYRKLLFMLDRILVQDQVSLDLLNSINYKNAEISGDIRYDRVDELSRNKDRFNKIENFVSDRKVFIAGSSWPLDEKLMTAYFLKNKYALRAIIAPHDVSKEHIDSILFNFKGKAIRYSEIDQLSGEDVLVVDKIGILSRIYKYAKISYVGGAFKEGLHNILEPAAYRIPVITGPDHSGFPEGAAMEKDGALFRVKNEAEFASTMDNLLKDEPFYSKASIAADRFIKDRKGASLHTLKVINQFL